MEASVWAAVAAAALLGVACSVLAHTWWRRLITGMGFPLSLALLWGLATGWALPAWAWLMPLAALLLIYPLNAWRDAPLFPTPKNALLELPATVPVSPGAAVLDAGCGLGHGLKALRLAYPHAALHGLEWSWPLSLACRVACPWAQVRRGDIWRTSWRPYALVYLFQRPESMARAHAKAVAELAAGAWLASLEFEVPGVTPTAVLRSVAGKPVWLYKVP